MVMQSFARVAGSMSAFGSDGCVQRYLSCLRSAPSMLLKTSALDFNAPSRRKTHVHYTNEFLTTAILSQVD